jgi:hypothetical protein
MHLIYPSAPDNPSRVDEAYAAEFDAARAAGLACSVISVEELESGNGQIRPPLAERSQVLYRGWMLEADTYSHLHGVITEKGGTPLTSPEQYLHCHHLPHWYPQCRAWTPETLFFPADTDLRRALSALDWPAFFIKDYVKSLTTQRGSVATTLDEAAEIVQLIERYRGRIEGGLCVRRFEQLRPETEERYFVINGEPYARDNVVPTLAYDIAAMVDCPFYSMDLVQAEDGQLRLIELGDGQVSDLKQWSPEHFAQVLSREFG